jgi:hypothetical protein
MMRDQLDAHLRRREHLGHRCCRLVLQRVGVDALGLFGKTGAGLELGIEILQHRVDRGGDVGHHLPVQSARGLGAHHAARSRHQQIVERVRAGIAFGDFDARVVVQIEIVQRAAL